MKRPRIASSASTLVLIALFLAVILPLANTGTASATTTSMTEYTTSASPHGICRGPDGNLWFTVITKAPGTTKIDRITPSGDLDEYTAGLTLDCFPYAICAGPDGNIWFTEYANSGNRIGTITPTGTISEHLVPTGNSQPRGICAGPDGNIWFTEDSAVTSKIGVFAISTGTFTEYVTGLTANCNPSAICSGPDGNLWFTERVGNRLGKIDPATGNITEYFTGLSANSSPWDICRGSDGNLWFTENATGKIGRITPSGTITEFAVPTANSQPEGICSGPDGNLWFAEYGTGKIGCVTTSGAMANPDYAVPAGATSQPCGICSGPDGKLWFTEYSGNPKVAKALIQYSVNATAPGGMGTVSPGAQIVNRQGSATINMTPRSGCHIAGITDNGVHKAVVNPYVIQDVTQDHNVVVAFAANPSSAFYFAEGTTRDNFAEYLCMGNPTDSEATAKVTYMFSDGTTRDASYTVPRNSRFTVNVNSEVGAGKDVSIRILSSTPNLVAERPMYFDYNGVWTGGSDAIGAVSPNRKWYFAEGNTLPEFDQYVTVLNPGNAAANLKFHYMIEGLGEKEVAGQVRPHSRSTFKTRDQIGNGKNESLYLESDQGVVAERPMYFNYLGLAIDNWTGGHDVVGTNSPARDWYFAEGTTRKNSVDGAFEEWLCLQNPGSSTVTVNATYQLGAGQGAPVFRSYTVPAQQRRTVSVNGEIGQDKDCSVHLSSTSDFIAERPMYYSYHPTAWTGGHDVLGANATAKTWYFAEGTTRSNFDEWLCLQNPGSKDADATITYYTTSGQVTDKTWTVKANIRLTVSANSDAGANQDISARVSSDNPIIVERPMYFNYQGLWNGGHDVVGFVPAQ